MKSLSDAPQGLGLRQSSGAFGSHAVGRKSGRGLPHSRTLERGSAPAPVQGKRRRSSAAFTILECMVYLGVFVMLLGFATCAFYRCYDQMKFMRRNSEDIIHAVHAGEAWRNDVRRAVKPIVFDPADQTLRIQRDDKEVAYRFADGQVFRKASAGGPWLVLLAKVQHSEMQTDSRTHVTAWRWELELQAQQKTARVRPLFTFVAAPPTQ